MSTTQISQTEIDQLIADEFGVNADYVSELLKQFEHDRTSVDQEWSSFFEELLSNGRVGTEGAAAPSGSSTSPKPSQPAPHCRSQSHSSDLRMGTRGRNACSRTGS